VRPGDIVVGGKNFGQGSSREHAPLVIKLAGVQAIVAQSVARIFFRNCVNIGLPVIVCDTTEIQEGDMLSIDLEKGVLEDMSRKLCLTFPPLPDIMTRILADGGLVSHVRKHGDFNLAG